MNNNKVCELCEGEGVVSNEMRFPPHPDSLEARYATESKCLCQIAGTDEFDLREDAEAHQKAGLAYGGTDDEGEDLWIGTDEQWKKYQNQ